MNLKSHTDFEEVLSEIRDTRNSIHVISDLNRGLLFDIRAIAEDIRLILSVMLGLIILIAIYVSWKFIALGLMWLIELVELLKKFDFVAAHAYAPFILWSFIIFISGFLIIFIVRAILITLKNWRLK